MALLPSFRAMRAILLPAQRLSIRLALHWVGGGISVGVGAMVLVSWALGVDVLALGGRPTSPNSALLFLVLGAAVLLHAARPDKRFTGFALAAAAVFSAVAAATTLIGIYAGWRVDGWLFTTAGTLASLEGLRMAKVTALSFGVAAWSLLALQLRRRTWAALLGFIVALVGAVCLAGLWFGAPTFQGGILHRVTLTTAVGLLSLGASLAATSDFESVPFIPLSGLITLAIFATDWLTPLGSADWVLYLIPVLLSAKAPGRPHILELAVICTVLMVIGFLLSPSSGIATAVALVNRAVGVAVLWIGAFLVLSLRTARDALGETNRRLTDAQRIGRVAGWTSDLSGRIEWSTETYRLYGVSPDRFSPNAESFLELIHPDDRQAMQQWIASCQGGESPGTLDFRCRWPDGTTRFLSGQGELIRDEDGRPTHLSGFVQDVTERAHADQALLASERRCRALVEHGHDAILLVGSDGAVLESSPNVKDVMGYTGEEVLHRSLLEFVHPDWRDAIRDRVADSLRKPGVGIHAVAQMRHKDGNYRVLEGMLTNLLDEPSVGAIVNNYRDVTEQRRAEEELRSSESKYSILFEKASLPAVLARYPDNVFLEVNDAWTRLFGFSREEALGKTSVELGINRNLKRRAQTMETLRLRKSVRDLEQTLYAKSGATLTVLANIDVLEIGGQEHTLASLQDVTESRKAEQELLASREQLRALAGSLERAREAERTHVAREIHDELGQTLAGLKMDLSWMEKRLASSATLLRERVHSMVELVDGTVATVRRIGTELRPGVLDDLGLVAATEWQVQEFERRSGLRTHLITHSERAAVIDGERSTAGFRILQEALTNVARHSQATDVNVALNITEEELILSVRDNGRGIDHHNPIRSDSFGLIGMRERASMWGGDLTVDSTVGCGTAITLRLPLRTAPRDVS